MATKGERAKPDWTHCCFSCGVRSWLERVLCKKPVKSFRNSCTMPPSMTWMRAMTQGAPTWLRHQWQNWRSLVLKFHSLKKATPDHQVQSSPWSLMLSNRCHPVAFQHLMALSALHLAFGSPTWWISSGRRVGLCEAVGGWCTQSGDGSFEPKCSLLLNAVIQGVTWTSLGATCLDKVPRLPRFRSV